MRSLSPLRKFLTRKGMKEQSPRTDLCLGHRPKNEDNRQQEKYRFPPLGALQIFPEKIDRKNNKKRASDIGRHQRGMSYEIRF